MSETLEMFVDEPIAPSGPAPIIIDRSSLQVWADCPHQAWLASRGHVSTGGVLASVGEAVHSILGEACRIRRSEGASAKELREYIEAAAASSRPDIQPQVVVALRRTYAITELLCQHTYGPERAPEDLIRFDGGPGEHSGQLAFDILPGDADGLRGPIRLTCELDLLMATASAEELDLHDWKSGWAHWAAGDVLDSFQFQFYSALVLWNYPAVNRVTVRVFNVREGKSTSAVTFNRSDLFTIQQRILSAVGIFLKYRDAEEAETVPAWAAPDKCAICPAAPRCKLAHAPVSDLAVNPEEYLRQYVAMQSAADQMKAALSNHIRKRGEDLQFEGVAFGVNKPKQQRAATCDFYVPLGTAEK